MLPLEEDLHMYYVAAVAESNLRELHLRTVLDIKCIHMQYQKVWLANIQTGQDVHILLICDIFSTTTPIPSHDTTELIFFSSLSS